MFVVVSLEELVDELRKPLAERKVVVEQTEEYSSLLYHLNSYQRADQRPLNTCYLSADRLDIEVVADAMA